ncbi:zinc finger and SCAN domain-containing protein 29-like [Gopherus flavomarginatus]|uniref:zinc finger and SCAN domain-containing protein 29-like n=1 Tax=Gopherus flavomarginatus TaxID=286002 RepID=UPI0021CB9DB1|nr:zinc finger and SCAN domain-containing protein 29-like [Gopherus flavomarginatus]
MQQAQRCQSYEQSQLHTSHKNFDTYGQIACSLQEKGYDWVRLQCRAKVKELRKVYHKAGEENCCSGAVPQTCHFYKELDGILAGDLTSTAKSTMDISVGLELVESVSNPEEEVTDEEVESEDGEPHDESSWSSSVLQKCLASLCSRSQISP